MSLSPVETGWNEFAAKFLREDEPAKRNGLRAAYYVGAASVLKAIREHGLGGDMARVLRAMQRDVNSYFASCMSEDN